MGFMICHIITSIFTIKEYYYDSRKIAPKCKTLIVYYSHSGNNEKLAYELKERIGCDIHI